MTPRSLFQIILKSLGILFIKEFLFLIPQFLTVFLYYQKGATIGEIMWIFLTTVVQLIVYSLVFYYLVFRTDRVIERLGLEKGFEEEKFSFSIHRSSVLSIVLIVAGILVIVDVIPSLCKNLFIYIRELRSLYKSDADITRIIGPIAQLIMGLVLIGSQKQIVNFIERKRRNTVIQDEQISNS